MKHHHEKRSVRPRGANLPSRGRMGVVAAALTAGWGMVAGTAVADVHDWTGATNTSFQNAGNWNIGQVPADGDAVIINGGSNNILLFADSPDLSSLYVGGSRDFFNMGHELDVTGGFNTTTVSGVFSSLVLSDAGAGGDFWTGDLTLQNEGLLEMDGGWAIIMDQFLMTGNSRISGHGVIEMTDSSASSMSGVDGESLTVSGGNLLIRNLNGGGIALPDNVNILQGLTLDLEAPLSSNLQNVYMEAGSTFTSDENRTLVGQMDVAAGGGAAAVIDGNGSFFIDGAVQVQTSSHLIFDDPMRLEPNADIWIGGGSTLEADTWYDADAGSEVSVSLGGLLKLDGAGYAGGWQGNIDTIAGTIEVNSFTNLHMHGTLTLRSFFAARSAINGSSAVIVHDEVSIPGAGAIINGGMRIVSGGQMSVALTAEVDVNGDLTLFAGSNSIGDGNIIVNDGGEFTVQETAYVGLDVYNDGTLEVGSFNNVDYIYIHGTYDQGATGRMEIQLGGDTNFDRDIVETADTVTLEGELNIELVNGYTPTVGDSFEIIWANGGLNGAFDSLTGEPGFSVTYGANTVLITYDGLTCPGDANGDFMIDVLDLLDVLSNWGPCGGVCPADFDGNGAVDVTDLLTVLSNWGACV